MDIAVVTGASSGLGLAISRRLLDLGFRVYGFGGNYTESTLSNVDFRPIPCDLADPAHVEAKIKEVLEQERAITVLVNNAKYYPPDDFARGAPVEFSRSLNINLLCPLILARWCLEGLKSTRGCIINISSATPETSRGGPVGACAAGGLRWMQESLFQQLREDGVAVSTIQPEPNRWRPEDAPPPNGERPQSAIDPIAVAEAVASIIHHGRSNVITEVVIRPERLAERTIPPVRELPYPKPKPIPYTVPREQIEAEERADREEEEREMGLGSQEEPKKKKRRRRGRGKKRPGEGPAGQNTDSEERASPASRAQREGGTSSRQMQPSDRRSDERRDPHRRDSERQENKGASQSQSAPVRQARSDVQATTATGDQEAGSQRSRRRKGRKPRPSGMSADGAAKSLEPRPGPLTQASGKGPETRPVEKAKPALADKQPVSKSAAPATKPAGDKGGSERTEAASHELKPVKKVARKATKKAISKKTAVKKTAAKKSAVKKTATKKTAAKKSAAKKTVGKKAARKQVKTDRTDAVDPSPASN